MTAMFYVTIAVMFLASTSNHPWRRATTYVPPVAAAYTLILQDGDAIL